jgi:aspartokinase
MTSRLQVMKFGGTSAGDAACIARAAQIIANAAKQSRCVTVVSAMSGVTNRLIDAAKKAEAGNADEAAAILDALRRQHETALADLIRQEEERTRIRRRIQEVFTEGRRPAGSGRSSLDRHGVR